MGPGPSLSSRSGMSLRGHHALTSPRRDEALKNLAHIERASSQPSSTDGTFKQVEGSETNMWPMEAEPSARHLDQLHR
jgi:hypothetical protein